MPFITMGTDAPDGLTADDFILRPIVAADAELDYAAVMMNLAETECLGCVYLMPTDARMFAGARITPVGGHRWEDFEAAVYFWVRRSRLETATDRALLGVLRTWLAKDWSLQGHLIVTSELFAQQAGMIRLTDLQLRFTVEEPDKPGRYLAYE